VNEILDFDPSYRKARESICQSAGRLVSVRYGSFEETPSFVSAVLLNFESGIWLLAVDPEDDTVRLINAAAGEGDEFVFHEPPESSPWIATYGSTVLWCWALENQQGYIDGIQFSFARRGSEKRLIQLVAAASRWDILAWDFLRPEA
jgi:hypothetical protein